MKKAVAKTNKKVVKKESEFEMLARIVSGGFNSMDKRFEKLENEMNERFDNVDKRFEDVNKRFDYVDKRFESVDTQISSLHSEQRETNRRLDVIERKQIGTRESFDNVVYKSEFKALAHKVDMLEKRVSKK